LVYLRPCASICSLEKMKPSPFDLITDITTLIFSGAVVASTCWPCFQRGEVHSVLTVGAFGSFIWFACAGSRLLDRIL
jgi:hypothetical protein